MRKKATELQTAISHFEGVVGLELNSVRIGLLPNEVEYGLADLASDGLDGEIVLSFEGGKEVYISWCGAPTNPGQGGWCNQVSGASFHKPLHQIQAQEGSILSKALGKTLTSCEILGEHNDPLVFHFVFGNTPVLIGNFDYADSVLVRESDIEQQGSKKYGELLWKSINA